MAILHPALFAFLDAIAQENSRAYFATVKPLYHEILASVTDLCQTLIDHTQIEHEDGRPLTPRDCLFRIYRDARRLKEGDQLYKHNFGFVISPRGKKGTFSGHYIHLEPNNTYFATGVYHPASDELHNLRHHLTRDAMKYLEYTHHPDFREHFGDVQGASLKRPPRGFQQYEYHMDLLRMKQHIVHHQYTEEEALAADFVEQLKKAIDLAKPRSDRLNDMATRPLE